MIDPTFPFFPIMAGLGFLLVLVPLPWHLEAWNSGTCYYMMWTALACLNQFVNSIVWSNDALNRAPVWCDICELQTAFSFVFGPLTPFTATRITLAAAFGIPASALCIMRRLYAISRVHAVSGTHTEASSSTRATKRVSLTCMPLETKSDSNRHNHLRLLSDDPTGPRCVFSDPDLMAYI